MTSVALPLRPEARTAFLRFLAVGVLNTAFGYGVYAAGVLAGLPAQAALALQFLLGALWNYRLHARLVFAVRGWGRLPAYVGAYLLIWALNALALRGLLAAGMGPLAMVGRSAVGGATGAAGTTAVPGVASGRPFTPGALATAGVISAFVTRVSPQAGHSTRPAAAMRS